MASRCRCSGVFLMCSAPCSVLCAKFIILCSVQCVHSATSTLQVSQFATYLLIGLLRCYVQRPNGPHRAELYSSDILRTQTFFLEGVYFMVYMARHDVGAQAYNLNQSRTVFSSGIVRIFKLFVLEGVQSFRHPSPIPTRKIELEPGCSFQVDCAR